MNDQPVMRIADSAYPWPWRTVRACLTGRLSSQRFSRGRFCLHREKQSHNAHRFETVTVYYRWHPLAGKNLRVHKRQKDRCGEYIFVQLPDDTICGLPAWMFNVACAEFFVGPPFISIEALTELRDLLAALRGSPLCDMPSMKEVLTEVPNEASAEAASSSVQSAPGGSYTNGAARKQKRRTRSRAGRTVTQRGKRKRRAKRGNRRSE